MTLELKKQPRPIIEEFAIEITNNKIEIPNAEVIKFRDDKIKNKTRKAYKVPIELLRFRKDNGRIASDVMTYEINKGPINEATDFGQSELKKFLEKKDPDPTKELTNSMIKDGQNYKAVITVDGFLINGNRRKMVLEKLIENDKRNADRYKYLEVVILPGLNESEPPPTIEDIEQVENRYQFQKEGKAEYYNFDMALAVQRKLDLGFELEEILLDDPNYSELKGKALKTKIKEFREEYLEPLKCVDRYLNQLNRPGHYNTVSEGKSDKDGRWQAFLDYSNFYQKMMDQNKRIKYNIQVQDGEEGKIENIAFKLIRKRAIDNVDKKAHKIMRDLPKLLSNQQSKKELFELTKFDFDLPKEEIIDENGEPVSEKTKDDLWGNKHASDFIWRLKNAYKYLEQTDERETPMDLLRIALDKLNHDKMDISLIEISRLDEARKLITTIRLRADDLEHKVYDRKRNKDELFEKHKKNKKSK